MKLLTTWAYYCFSLHTCAFIYRQVCRVDYLETQNGVIFPEHFSLVVQFETTPQPPHPNQNQTETKPPNVIPGLRVKLHGNQPYPEQEKA